MTATNPHPLANPLNQSRFRNYMYGQKLADAKPFLKVSSNPNELTVPDARPFGTIWTDGNSTSFEYASKPSQLEVPNSDIPYFNGPIPMHGQLPTNGFIGESPLFKLLDGSIVDLKMHKVVYDPSKNWKANGYWSNPNEEVKRQNDSDEWKQDVTIEQMVAGVYKPNAGSYDPNLSPESVEYWKRANEESKKLEQNLTNEQKKLLDDLHSGKIFPLSRLEDEK